MTARLTTRLNRGLMTTRTRVRGTTGGQLTLDATGRPADAPTALLIVRADGGTTCGACGHKAQWTDQLHHWARDLQDTGCGAWFTHVTVGAADPVLAREMRVRRSDLTWVPSAVLAPAAGAQA